MAPAFLKAASANNAMKGFALYGLWPYNRNIFSEEDFAPPSVTGRPLSDTTFGPSSLHSESAIKLTDLDSEGEPETKENVEHLGVQQQQIPEKPVIPTKGSNNEEKNSPFDMRPLKKMEIPRLAKWQRMCQ